MSISFCPFCGTEVVCFDHEDWGGPTPGCQKCGIAFIKEVRYKFIWSPKEELVKVEALNPHTGEDNTPKHDDYDLFYRKKHQSSVSRRIKNE